MTTTSQTSAETDVVSLDIAITLEPVSAAPFLITEQEVVFNTAAAALVRPATTHRRWPGTTLFRRSAASTFGCRSRDRSIRDVKPVTSSRHGCLATWNAYERAPCRLNG